MEEECILGIKNCVVGFDKQEIISKNESLTREKVFRKWESEIHTEIHTQIDIYICIHTETHT